MNATAFWFLLTGAASALTHMGVFALVQHQHPDVSPEAANALGFVIAFVLSFGGHRWLSFKGTSTPIEQSLLRFGVTALAGFACNEVIFMALTRHYGWFTLLALFVALVVASALTFVLSRFWAFQR
jgi:putative flippase GtrA